MFKSQMLLPLGTSSVKSRDNNMKNKLIKFRETFGYSQERLSEKLGVSRQTIISIGKGKYNPSLPLAMIIAEIFRTNVEEIFMLVKDDYKVDTKGRKNE